MECLPGLAELRCVQMAAGDCAFAFCHGQGGRRLLSRPASPESLARCSPLYAAIRARATSAVVVRIPRLRRAYLVNKVPSRRGEASTGFILEVAHHVRCHSVDGLVAAPAIFSRAFITIQSSSP